MQTYSIRELSERYELPASTLRYYEEIGLLEHVVRKQNQSREYNDEHICRLDAISCFKRAGMTLQQILCFFELEKNVPEHVDEIVALMREQEASVTQSIQTLQEALLVVRHKIRYYEDVRTAIKDNTCWPCWDDVS